MKVKIRLFGRIGKNIGSELILDLPRGTGTIGELFLQLTDLDPALEDILWESKTEINTRILILKNGHPIVFTGSLDTLLQDDDRVSIDSLSILEVVGGGAH